MNDGTTRTVIVKYAFKFHGVNVFSVQRGELYTIYHQETGARISTGCTVHEAINKANCNFMPHMGAEDKIARIGMKYGFLNCSKTQTLEEKLEANKFD
jgi:hypothetical protein